MSHRAEYIAALRAYPAERQAFGLLHSTASGTVCMCALGVGFELYREAHPELSLKWHEGFLVSLDRTHVNYVQQGNVLAWLGLSDFEGEHIADLNDDDRRTTAQIADWLEAHS